MVLWVGVLAHTQVPLVGVEVGIVGVGIVGVGIVVVVVGMRVVGIGRGGRGC